METSQQSPVDCRMTEYFRRASDIQIISLLAETINGLNAEKKTCNAALIREVRERLIAKAV